MVTTSNLSSIIRFYAEKQKSPFIDFREFCSYVKKYAEHHVEEQSELVKYLGDPAETVSAELQGLQEKHLAAVVMNGTKKTIVSISFFSVKYANQYKEILTNEVIAYPVATDLPKLFPFQSVEKKQISEHITAAMERQNLKSPELYIINFKHDIAPIVLPACVPVKVLLETAQQKIRHLLAKEEFHDYFLKKLRSTNAGKEITIKNFFEYFVNPKQKGFIDLHEGDDYYLWNQLCYYIRQDFEKIQDRTTEDTNILQAIEITESYNIFLKTKFQQEEQKREAFRNLTSALGEAPYFHSMDQILKFHDAGGRLLYGQYSEDELRDFLQKMTTESAANELPKLLTFKPESGTQYYVYKSKVLQLTVRLCNEAHGAIESALVQEWYGRLLNYDRLPEMSDDAQFEACLAKKVEELSPVLHAILSSNFMTFMAYEKDDTNSIGFHIFLDGKLRPLSDLLMLDRTKILSLAKTKLPFIYTIPLISWIIAALNGRKKQKGQEKQPVAAQETLSAKKPGKTMSRQEAVSKKAGELFSEFVPEGSTVDRELDFLCGQWNRMLTKEANIQLTEDVNSLIRDYTRRVMKTLTASTFTKERVKNLAATLVRTPNMQKIKDSKSLTEYVELYILRLVSNY